MRRRLAQGDNLVLFPEGTSSDGSRVLPFRSAFFAIAEGRGADAADPAGFRRLRPAREPARPAAPAGRCFAWYGDMDIAPHFWRLGQQSGLRVTVLLHTPLDPTQYANRKALSQAVWNIVADGAAALRQNRPAQPLASGDGTEAAGGSPAFA